MNIKYCPKCHKAAYTIQEDEESIKVVQNGRSVLNISKKSNIDMSFSCPDGHPVKLMIGFKEEQSNAGSRN